MAPEDVPPELMHSRVVIAGLDPAIHPLRKIFCEE
jgi:hypothetical protein